MQCTISRIKYRWSEEWTAMEWASQKKQYFLLNVHQYASGAPDSRNLEFHGEEKLIRIHLSQVLWCIRLIILDIACSQYWYPYLCPCYSTSKPASHKCMVGNSTWLINAWLLATHVGDPDGLLGFSGMVQPWLLWIFEKWTSGRIILSPSVTLIFR